MGAKERVARLPLTGLAQILRRTQSSKVYGTSVGAARMPP